MPTHMRTPYYDKVLHQKFEPLYVIFQIIQLLAMAFYVRRYFKGSEKIMFLPILFFFLRLVDFYYRSELGYNEIAVVTSNVALIPFSILIAKYASFLPRYNDLSLSNESRVNIFSFRNVKHFFRTIKIHYQKTWTPLLAFNGCLLLLMALEITNRYVTNLFFGLSALACFVYLLRITLEVRLAKDIRTKANFLISNLFIMALFYGLKVVLPWKLYSDKLYSLFFSVQYLVELSSVVLMTDVMTSLMLIKYIVYV